jgi:hypothetical protein
MVCDFGVAGGAHIGSDGVVDVWGEFDVVVELDGAVIELVLSQPPATSVAATTTTARSVARM